MLWYEYPSTMKPWGWVPISSRSSCCTQFNGADSSVLYMSSNGSIQVWSIQQQTYTHANAKVESIGYYSACICFSFVLFTLWLSWQEDIRPCRHNDRSWSHAGRCIQYFNHGIIWSGLHLITSIVILLIVQPSVKHMDESDIKCGGNPTLILIRG